MYHPVSETYDAGCQALKKDPEIIGEKLPQSWRCPPVIENASTVNPSSPAFPSRIVEALGKIKTGHGKI